MGRKRGVAGGFANHRKIDGRRCLPDIKLRAFTGDLFIGGEYPHQRTGPAVATGSQQAQRFNHRHQRSFGIAGTTTVQASLALGKGKGIAMPAAAGRHCIQMGIKGEAGSGTVVQNRDDVGAPRRIFTERQVKTGLAQPACHALCRFALLTGRIFCIDGNQCGEVALHAHAVDRVNSHYGSAVNVGFDRENAGHVR